MKRIFLLVVLAFIGFVGHSQTAALYSFQAFSTPYATITTSGAATNVGGIICDDCTTQNINLGFTFSFCGTNYTRLSACSNGWASLNNSGSVAYTPATGNIGGAGWLMPFWSDLYGNYGGCGNTSSAYYLTTGIAPNRIFTMEWYSFNAFGWAGVTTCGRAFFQIKLYETSNIIDFCYGNSTSAGMIAATIGIANSGADWQTLNNNGAAPTPSSTNFYTTNFATAPTNGQVYRWIPCGIVLAPTSNSPICVGSTLNLLGNYTSGLPTSYTWNGPLAYTSAVQNPSITGVTAAMAGTYSLTATDGTCSLTATTNVVINSTPAAITGPTSVCTGSTITLANTTTTGTWTSGSPAIANVVSGTGVVSGIAAGTAIITYINNCGTSTYTVTVNQTPAAISGPTSVCPGSTITLGNTVTGGTWSSSAATATVGLTTGVVTGVTSGNANITYTTTGGCTAVTGITVNVGPPPFTITPPSASFCTGSQMFTVPVITGSNVTTIFPSTAAFTVPNNTPAGIINNIAVTGIPAGATIADVSVILNSVTMPNDGQLTFNILAPNGNNLNLVNREGGNNANFANTIISSLGGINFTASTAPFTNTFNADAVVPTGPTAFQSNVTTWPSLYSVPNGNWALCSRDWAGGAASTATVNTWYLQIHYTTPTVTYVWTPAAGLYTDAALTTPYVAGASAYTVYASPASSTTYTATSSMTGTTCTNSSTATVTISGAGSGGISGPTSVCNGGTITLSTAVSGGTWFSANTTVATVTPGPGAGGGVVSGVSIGTAVISYINGCISTTTITVNANPSAITGVTSVCAGATTQLSNSVTGGGWSSATPGVAVIDAVTGLVTGVSAGTSAITFTAPGGCTAITTVTVTAIPGSISGPTVVCGGSTITLSDAITGGTWSSSNATTASVTSAGVVTGGAIVGTAVITYSNGCGSPTATVTVNQVPTAILGATSVCTGATLALSDAITGGTWVSGTTAVANINPTTGLLTPVAVGNTTITYSTGCGAPVTSVITVNSAPTVITGTTVICVGATSTLSNNGVPVGIWTSSNPAIVTVNSTTGLVTSVANNGFSTITATNTCGSKSVTFQVSSPSPITGTLTFCQSSTTTLSDTVAGGTWTSGNPSVATTSGIINDNLITGAGPGIPNGSAVITYTLPSGCFTTTTVNTTPAPAAIVGSFSICECTSTTLNDVIGGGTWSSSNPSVATIVPVGPNNLTVNGVCTGPGGTTVINYSLFGCFTSATMTINPQPGAISGPSAVCVNANITLSNSVFGGNWSSSATAIATVDAGGVVYGVTQGTTTITYTVGTGCYATKTITVNPIPAAIVGATTVCAGQSISLSDGTPTGVWSSSNIGVATVTGNIITGVPPGGTAIISYTLPLNGCFQTTTITVNPLPSAILGVTTLCSGGLTSQLFSSPAGGAWSSSNPTVASISAGGLVTSGAAPGGTTVITYTSLTGCTVTTTVTVNPMPVAITGNTTICAGATTQLTDLTTGGTWSSSATVVGTIGATTGFATGGAVTSQSVTVITYTRAGCAVTTTLTVNPLPAAITGSVPVCVNSSITLADATTGGTWSSNSPIASFASSTSGILTGNAPGGTATITYSLATGCAAQTTVTVNPLPATISGNTTICAGNSSQLSDSPAGGIWSSTGTTISINNTTGLLSSTAGYTASTGTVTYTLGTGCSITTPITINPLPQPIFSVTGVTSVCVGLTVQLTDFTTGGNWTSANGNATVNGTGLVTGITSPGTTITYTLPTTCYATQTVTVNPLPGPISGPNNVCVNSTIQLTNTVAGGAWSSSATTIAAVNSSLGVVTGVTQGNVTITYTQGSGCYVTYTVQVNPGPVAITGNLSVCVGLSTTLSDATFGGTWVSGAPSVAQLGSPTSGTVTGQSSGQSVISYILPTGCAAVATLTVNPLPAAITGATGVCEGSSIFLSDITVGGTWSSSNNNVATINPGNGTLYGVLAGLDTVTYTNSTTGCIMTRTVSVNVQPVPLIGGPLNICMGATGVLSDVTIGGTWSSNNTNASVSTVGVVTGVHVGTSVITYSVGSCYVTALVNVATQPVAITGNTGVCLGATTTLADATPGGGWTTSNASVATVAGGVVYSHDTGTAVITYTIGSCSSVTTVTVNVQPGSILGTTSFCNHTSVTLSNATTGGTWSSANTNVATVDQFGVVTGNVASNTTASTTIIYTVGSCSSARSITVNPQPVAISGNPNVCTGSSTQLSDATLGGIWTTSNVSVASVNSGGTVFGLTATTSTTTGTAIITYTVGSCATTTTVTVNPLPSVVTGIFYICQGSSTTLGDLSTGGTWSSANTSIAAAGIFNGVITGVSVGTTNITYTLPTGCIATHTISVIAVPGPIQTATGASTVCATQTLQLIDATSGGTWVSSNTAIASVDTNSGLVLGQAAGTVIISYTLGSGCGIVTAIAVNPLSPILGTLNACIGQTTNLSDTTLGGTWISGNTTIATVNPVTGVVTGTGLTGGVAVISYTLPSGCQATTSVNVGALPAVITGNTSLCLGQTNTLNDASIGGVWSSSDITVAPINSSNGDVFGQNIGTAVITYINGGCPRTTTVTVNPSAAPITGTLNLCQGQTTTLSNTTPGGSWFSSNTLVASINASNGFVTTGIAGNTTITYIPATGCSATALLTVNPAPGIITGHYSVCVGDTTSLSNGTSSGGWLSSDGTVASIDFVTGLVTGVGAGTATITYMVPSGCTSTVAFTVNPSATPISGGNSVCIGGTLNLISGVGSGVWSSDNVPVASIGTGTGLLTAGIAGTTNITFTLISTGCKATEVVTVNSAPAAITGITSVCVNNTTTLIDATPGGVWTSSNPIVASISSSSTANPVTITGGNNIGSVIITYTAGTGCIATTSVAVNFAPTPITGPSSVCVGSTITLFEAGSPGVPNTGTWTSTAPTTASVDPLTGVVTGNQQGNVFIYYTNGGGSCYVMYHVTVNPVPLPITGNMAVCQGLTTQLFDATGGGAWSISGPATISSTGLVTGSLSSFGPATVTYTVGGCSAVATVMINTLPAPISGNPNICLGNTRTYTDSPTPGTWSSNNTAIASIDPATGIATGLGLGTARITYTITSSGCIQSETVEVHPLPAVFNMTGGGSYCSYDNGVLVGLSGSEIGVQYYLYLGATPVGTYAGTGFALNFGLQTTGGVYTVIATNTYTTCSTQMTGSETVTVIPRVRPIITLTANPAGSVCAGTSITYTETSTGGGTTPTYQWAINGVAVPAATTTTYSYVPANNDVVQVTLTSSETCALPRTVDTTLIAVVNTPVVPAVGVLFSPGDTVCSGTAVILSAVPSFGGTAPYYIWIVNGTQVGTGGAYSYVPSNGDIVYVRMASNYQCRLADTVASAPDAIDVINPVTPVVTITASPGTLVTTGDTVMYTATVVNAVSPTYQWYVNGVPVTGATSSTYTMYNVRYPLPDSVGCQVTNSGYCAERSFGWIYEIAHPTGVTQVTGNSSNLSVLPNPTKGMFTLSGTLSSTRDELVTIELTDMLGQVVLKTEVVAKGGKLNEQLTPKSTLANGMYMLNVRTDAEHKVFHLVVEQ